ncbi:MAG: hypothetical protein JHC95_13585 [Solirubrobacteraceae bacterium]|nr:hypothetical protein [Solirubrobacteraceae bacterium]
MQRRRWAALSAVLIGWCALPAGAHALQRDPGFHLAGQAGFVRDDLGGQGYAEAVAPFADGTVMVAGRGVHGGDNSMAIAVYFGNGQRDPSFSGDGMVLLQPTGTDARATDALVDRQGRIVVVGQQDSPKRLIVARVLRDGTLDRSFGDVASGPGGHSGYHLDDAGTVARTVTEAGDGSYVVGGAADCTISAAAHTCSLVQRYSATGAMTGERQLDAGWRADAGVDDIDLNGDGSVVAVGGSEPVQAGNLQGQSFVLDGAALTLRSTSFRRSARAGQDVSFRGVALTGSRLSLAGQNHSFTAAGRSGLSIASARFEADGTPIGARVDLAAPANAGAYAAAPQASGKTLVAGDTVGGGVSSPVLARLQVGGGALDPSFVDLAAPLTQPLGAVAEPGLGQVVQWNAIDTTVGIGRVYVAGTAQTSLGGSSFLIARYTVNRSAPVSVTTAKPVYGAKDVPAITYSAANPVDDTVIRTLVRVDGAAYLDTPGPASGTLQITASPTAGEKHTAVIQAMTEEGIISEDTVLYTQTNAPPTVVLTRQGIAKPAPGDNVGLKAVVDDPDGTETNATVDLTIARTGGPSYTIRNQVLGLPSSATDFGYAIVQAYGAGTYTVTAKATDEDGGTASQTLTFTVTAAKTDTDGDGLPDSWEKDGDIDEDGKQDLDLKGWGADPKHKDLFVRMDWMKGKQLSRTELKKVVAAYAAAPVDNPDGKQGIRLHVDHGSDSVMDPEKGTTWGKESTAAEVAFQAVLGTTKKNADGTTSYDWTDFDKIRDAEFTGDRTKVFRYALAAHRYKSATNSSSGLARSGPSANFMVTLGTEKDCGAGVAYCSWGTPEQEARTFMHELGHTLGLDHGGTGAVNYSPVYPSLMSYLFQLTGVPSTTNKDAGLFAYSALGTDTITGIDEAKLDETKGAPASGAGSGQWSRYYCTGAHAADKIQPFQLGKAVDWDCDGKADKASLSGSVTNDTTDAGADTDRLSRLYPTTDWVRISYEGGAVGGTGAQKRKAPKLTSLDELSRERQQQIARAVLNDAVKPKAKVRVLARRGRRVTVQITASDTRGIARLQIAFGRRGTVQIPLGRRSGRRAITVTRTFTLPKSGAAKVSVVATDRTGNLRTTSRGL